MGNCTRKNIKQLKVFNTQIVSNAEIIPSRKDIILKSFIKINLVKELGILTSKYDYYFNNKLETSINNHIYLSSPDRKSETYWFDDTHLIIVRGWIVYSLNLETQLTNKLYEHDSSIFSIKILSYNTIISSDLSYIIIWKLDSMKKIQITKDYDLQNITIFDNWIVCHLNHEIQVWDLEDYTCKHVLIPPKVNQYPMNTFIVFNNKIACDCGLFIKVWDFNKKKLDYSQSDIHLQGHTEAITVICPLENNKIISGSYDKTLRLWNLITQECEHIFSNHYSDISSILPLPNNRCVSADSNGMLIIWDLNNFTNICHVNYVKPHTNIYETNKNKINIMYHEISGQILCWSENGNRIPIGNMLNNLCILNPDTGKIDQVIIHDQFIYSIFISSDGRIGVRFKDKIEIYS